MEAPKSKRRPWTIERGVTNYEKKRRNQSFYNSRAWRKLRQRILDSEPLCRSCKAKGIITEATEIDHIKPINESGNKWDINNLQPLCKSCHSSKTAKENS